jgi:hypothetical protein
MARITGLFRSRRPVRALPWANDVSRWPLIRAPRRPDMARAEAARRAHSEPWWVLAALWALAALFAAITVLSGVAPHDEGLMLQGAQRIADGQFPYRDFWTNYGPGQFLVLGALVKLLGPSLLVWRIARIAVVATAALLAFVLARRETSLGWGLAAWAGAAGALAFPAGAGPNATAIALGLAAVALARRAPAGAGALAAGASLFRPELGVAAALGVAIAIGRGGLARVAVGFVATGVVLWLGFLVAAPGDLLSDVGGFLGIQNLQRLPFPWRFHGEPDPNRLLEFYGPAILLAGLALWAVDAAARRAGAEEWALAPLAFAGAAYLLGRSDEFHLAPLAVVLPVLLAVRCAREEAWLPRALLGIALAFVVAQAVERQAALIAHPVGDRSPAVAAADGVRVDAADATAIERLQRYVDARVPPGDPILVAPPRFDRVRVGDPLLYVLLDRPNPTRYDVMQPGVVTTADTQREIVADLRAARPAVVVRWLAPTATRTEDNGSRESSGVTLVDDYLRAAYRPAARFGDYEVLRKTGV